MVQEEEARINARIRYAAKAREDALLEERLAMNAAKRAGYEEGYAIGYKEGLQEDIKMMSNILRKMGLTEEQIQKVIDI